MLSKSEIKDIQSLSHKKFRDALNLFIAEGPKIVTELIQLIPDRIERIYASAEWKNQNENLQNVIVVTPQELERISQQQTPNEVLAVFKKPDATIPTGDRFTIYLDAIQDPGNFGSIIRTADWFGIHHIVCSAGCA